MKIARLQVNGFHNNVAVQVLKGAPLIVLGLLLASCAGTPANNTAGADEECVYVRVTGSNLPIKECRSKAERDAIAAQQQAAAQNSVRDIQLLDETGGASLGADSLNP
ncbi:MAG TPA: hypothetical protein GX696_00105 [Pseudomonadaceae bacterium]|nr:hypothetical protein [Pseudomonadaceae bacterium]